MSGIFGWLGLRTADPEPAFETMAQRNVALDHAAVARVHGPGFALGAAGLFGTATIARRDDTVLALLGHPWWEGEGGKCTDLGQVAQRVLAGLARDDIRTLDSMHGDFALVVLQPGRERALLATDRMGVHNLVYTVSGNGIIFGPTCDVVGAHSSVRREIVPQQIYNYVHFHMVPGPATVFRDMSRVPPGGLVDFQRGAPKLDRYWQMQFHEDRDPGFATQKQEFRKALDDAVRDYAADSGNGTFLSGGTDSSTISGLVGKVTGKPARTFSIGFDSEGYDEMHYARLAARHFATDQHEYYVTPDDVVDAIPRIAAAYDQPFGNASAIPTYYCARLAREHAVQRMLGGDGGDELFGGNSRYGKQHQFSLYERIPAPLRRAVLEPVARRMPANGLPALLRKARSYIEQASMPMPDRYESYNLLVRLGPPSVFTAEFLTAVDHARPIALMRQVYADTNATSLINRMLALDFQFTLTDNDLPKVTRMCELAGVDIAFPMLHDDVLDFSATLGAEQKLRGTTLRPFFKEALSDLLPLEILKKEKHGFGLPVGAWLQSHAPLRALAGDSLTSLRGRGIVRPEFIDQLLDRRLHEHAGYYGTMVWVLMMLELWFQEHAA